MSENKKQVRQIKVKKKNEYRLGFNWFFWICCVIVAVPCIYFVVLLYQSSIEGHTPVIGDRLNNSISKSIEEEQIQQISTKLNAMVDIENANMELKVATLRITINAKDDLELERYQEMVVETYNTVIEILPVETYFTLVDDYKQYDLEINLYDVFDKDDPVIVNLTKIASNENYSVQVLSQARDEELKQEILEEQSEDDEEESTEEEETEE